MAKSRLVLEHEKISVGFDGSGRILSFEVKDKGLDFFKQKSRFMGTLLADLRVGLAETAKAETAELHLLGEDDLLSSA